MILIDLWIIVQALTLILILFGGLELILRNEGVKPSNEKKTKSEIIPKDKFYGEHSLLGFVNQEGEFLLNINDSDFTFSASHDKQGHRITSNIRINQDRLDEGSELWIFGCSFIYGWLVEDDQTFPWLLQSRLDDWKVTNFAVSGYSTLQSYLQCKEAFASGGTPEIVMVFYGSKLHDQRNVLSRNRKKAFTRLDRISPFKVPCGMLDNQGKLSIKYERIKYSGLPLFSNSALMNYMDDKLNRYLDSQLNEFEVSKKILTEFHQLCNENNSTFVVGGIVKDKKTKAMLEYCKQQGMETIDIALDRRPEHVHDYDFHPSPLAHQKYADQLTEYLSEKGFVAT